MLHRPYSSKYQEHVALVDRGVKKVAELAESHWGYDNQTAFIFTADHGMTDWGAHGTGMPHETDVPLVAWGGGIVHQSGNRSQMLSIAQVDLAPLMSSLLGVAVPKNSVGRLPWEMLSLPQQEKVEAAMVVAKQMFQKLATHRRRFDKRLIHQPFNKIDQKKFDTVLQVSFNKRYETNAQLVGIYDLP
jgi:phosphatidylinositol glycan class N